MFKKYSELPFSRTSMLCGKLGDFILFYGGSDFPDKLPPEGSRKVYNDIYILDRKFNILHSFEGEIFPDNGICVEDDKRSCIWYILGDKIYFMEFDGKSFIEKEYFTLPEKISSGFFKIIEDDIIFGSKNVYKFNILNKSLIKLKEFPGENRNQSLNFADERYIYVFGGASNICYLDAYKYDIYMDKWEKLKDLPTSFLGASFCKLSENEYLVCGGFNKEVYDNAVKNLSDINFKKKYFSLDRKDFKWNKMIYIYDSKNDIFKKIKEDINSANCGAKILKFDNKIYQIQGELKPGLRSNLILEGDIYDIYR